MNLSVLVPASVVNRLKRFQLIMAIQIPAVNIYGKIIFLLLYLKFVAKISSLKLWESFDIESFVIHKYSPWRWDKFQRFTYLLAKNHMLRPSLRICKAGHITLSLAEVPDYQPLTKEYDFLDTSKFTFFSTST